ncbi:GAP family protein [Corynebacterium kalidii]|uniref:GAP family protein n=1 Tax=Corynebacterium kalidii TaxID=2931982 RepID=A0A9X1WK98_9CORY|nr:GAP family protein [Corynebacterium kalidii]MCJ7859748.1 GAP family protein [Corynebacterium kalidii]
MSTLPESFSYLTLAVLALVDSTSIGTLVVPVLLLVVGGAGVGAVRIATSTVYYLMVIGLFYWAVGLALAAGALPLLERFGDALASPGAMTVYAVIGVLLVVWSFRIDPKAIRKRGGDPEAGARRWAERVRTASLSYRALTGLALLAGLAEVATMVPYLAAIGVIVDSGAGIGRAAVLLAAYCALMVAPAALLAAARIFAGRHLDGVLTRVHDWSIRSAAGAFSWAVGIVGVVVVLNTAPTALAFLQ